MSNRFTEKAEAVLNNTTEIAESYGHTYIGSEHILISLLREKETAASIILMKNKINYSDVCNVIKEYSGFGSRSTLSPSDMTPRCRKIVENSYRISIRYGAAKIGTEHILLSLLEEKECVAVKMLILLGADVAGISDEVMTVLRTAEKHFETQKTKKESGESAITQYGKNLTDLAYAGKLDPVIGRNKETERLIRILSRKTKNNPCLIGEAGVGKTAIVEGLALRIAKGDVPAQIKNKSIVSVDLTSMVAGAKYRGDFEERIKNLISEASKNKSIILFIDEIHTIVGAGSAEGAIDAANILKPQLSRAEIQLIGATTFSEYHKYIEKDAALERRFQAVTVEEPSADETVEILKGLRKKYEEHHKVKISDEAIETAVRLSERYVHDRYQPDKAIDIIDETCAKANISKSKDNIEQNKESDSLEFPIKDYELALKYHKLQLSESSNKTAESDITIKGEDVEHIINEMTGIPVLGVGERCDSKELSARLKEKVVGQDEAVNALAMAVMRSESGITNPDRPKGVFLFLGESGVGKTELAKALTYELFRDKKALIRYDMSEFVEKNSVTTLIGSPPGYVGYEDGGSLTERIRRHPYSVVLFDEIEKAHSDVLNVFLQIMDEGVLTDSMGRSTSFKNAYVIMTSNALSFIGKDKNVGFMRESDLDESRKRLYEIFKPEFINRIDSIIHFSRLDLEKLTKIAENKLCELRNRLESLKIRVEFAPGVAKYIAERAEKERLGARAVIRVITTEIENKVSSAILGEQVEGIKIDVFDGEIKLEVLSEKIKAL